MMNRQIVEINDGTPVTDDGLDWIITVLYPDGVRMDVLIPKESAVRPRPGDDCLYPGDEYGLNCVTRGHYE